MSNEKTHWMQSPNKNYLGHWDLPESGELILTIESAQWEAVTDPVSNKVDSKRIVKFQEEGVKPWICNAGNAIDIVKYGGVKFMEDSKGVQICLYIGEWTDRKTKESMDVVRVKPIPVYTLEVLIALRDEKFKLMPESLEERLNDIVINQEVSSYAKTIKYLQALK
jgi:hypothetical protein